MNACRLVCALIALLSLISTALAEEIFRFDPSAGVSLHAGWVDSPGAALLIGEGEKQVLQVKPWGQAQWKYPVKPAWKFIRVRTEFRVADLKPGSESYQNARVMVRFDEKPDGGKQWYGASPALTKDSDWQTQELYSEVPAGAGVLVIVPAVFADSGTMEIRKLEVEGLGEDGRERMKTANFMAGTSAMVNGQIINGDFEAGQVGWTGFGEKVSIVEQGGNQVLRVSSDTPAWAVISATYRLPEGLRAARISARVSVKNPGRGVEGYMWPRITATPLDGKSEHVGGWPALNFEKDTPPGSYSFVADFPREAKAVRIEVGLMNASGEIEVDDIRIEPLAAGGAPVQLPESLAIAREAQKLNVLSPTRGEIVLNGLWRFMPAVANAAKEPAGDFGWIWVPGAWNRTDRAPGIVAGAVSPAWSEFDPDTNVAAWYERSFTIPQDWGGRAILLELQRVSTDAAVSCNGIEVAQVKWPGGVVDLTKAAKVGENTLRLRVVAAQTETESANLMGVGAGQVTTTKTELQTRGIIGDVVVTSRPQGAHVSDIFVKTSTRQRKVTLDTELSGITQAGSVKFIARMLNEKGVEEKRFEKTLNVPAAESQRLELTFDWADPRLWDLDQPNLYTLTLSAEGEGAGAGLRDEYSQRFGFREFWIGEDDGKLPTEQGQIPNRLKVFLNGSEFRMRPTWWDDSYSLRHTMREGAVEYLRGFRGVGFNTVEIWPGRKGERGVNNPREVWMTVADEMGVPLLGAGPESTPFIVNLANWSFTWDTRRAEYERYAEAEVRRMRNHPSVIMWSTNANFFGHNQDQNPRYIGRRGWIVDDAKSYKERQAAGAESLQFLKKLDPTRPVFTHMGGQEFGDISATNHYLCFIPLQEREEWMSYWAQNGSMPYIAIEFGTPLVCSFMRGRAHGGWGGAEAGGAMTSEPQVTEFSAIYLGPKAYQQETEAYRNYIPTRFIKDQLYNSLNTGASIVTSPNLQDIELLFLRNTWRSWRTLGISSMVPWELAHGWQGDNGDPTMEKMPPFEPGRLGAYFPELPRNKLYHLQAKNGAKPNPSATALKEACAETMAWIAGPEKLEYAASAIPDSTNAPQAKAPPAFMSKDHNFYAGEILRKQAVLINDSRREQTFQTEYTVELNTKQILRGESNGTISSALTTFLPISAQLPEVSEKQSGIVRLRAKIGDQVHTDELAFTVFPRPAKLGTTVFAFDPEGETTKTLERLGAAVKPWDGSRSQDVLIIGRNAMSSGAKLPSDLEAFARGGGRLLIMGQDPQWMRDYLGLRVNRQVTRRVFPLTNPDPLFVGLDAEDLRDWRGEGTLVQPYSPAESLIEEAPYGWKWGNRGSISSAAIEKPHHSGWTPLLECEFDLAYTPLMEMKAGFGRVVVCTLDIEGRTCADPVADLILHRLITRLASLPKIDSEQLKDNASEPIAIYRGGPRGEAMLKSIGAHFHKESDEPVHMRTGPLIIGEGADVSGAKGASQTVIVLPRTSDEGGLPLNFVKDAYPQGLIPDLSELRGLSRSDLHWRLPCAAWLLRDAPGLQLIAGGQIGIERVGVQGRVIYLQLDPDRYNADVNTYYRFTRWRQTRALTQMLANAGVSFEMDSRVLKPSRVSEGKILLAGEWQARITQKVAALPDGTIPDKGMSELAKRLVMPDATDEGWRTVKVPGLWEAYGAEWGEFDGEAVFRKVIEIPAEFAGKELTVHLGAVDDFDDTFWDGKQIGHTDITTPQFYALPREYKLTPEQTTAGKHVLAVRIFDHKGGGGFNGTPAAMSLRPPVEVKLGLYYPDFREDHDLGDDPARYKRW